ncbi:pyridoxamine 5'-phosphate oxidase family protein [Streptomyces corynorhini]|uniref:Pyridoxamine 5'-phosphate oxidase family protein n=1 Tax=Streptomyces corynorhini TaxID=2282652 RepID=A0A370B468_9ACTN|nr:pyridoxamine 5'-phosphate oxidase family protein [Streptomyces corynorhini]RDG34874.1 pyridoxamine 5'-phosphate oxidase family protein [Streptomyces corynorhini]
MIFTWADVLSAEPRFAENVERRFEMYPSHVLATFRKDRSPRVTGLEVHFLLGELWLGMAHNSLKARDLARDPRFAVQANPGAGDARADGDVRIAGRAVEVTERRLRTRYVDAVRPPLPFQLFRVDVAEIVQTEIEGDDLVLRSWRPGRPLHTVRRGTEGAVPPGNLRMGDAAAC